MKGRIIVFEGLDCSGKTTVIEEILKQRKNENKFVYAKGIGSQTFIGKISRKLHCTFMFFIELIYMTLTRIIPAIKEGKNVLQDRYSISITSYVPLVNKWYNQLFIKIFSIFVIEPDALVYLTLSINERIKRLKQKGTKYELFLSKNPGIIELREREYRKYYEDFAGRKIKIDTEKNSISKCAEIIERFIKDL